MGKSEVLLCPYRYLEDVMLKQRTQNSTLLLLPVPDNSASQSYLCCHRRRRLLPVKYVLWLNGVS